MHRFLILLLIATGCTTSKGFLDYEKLGVYASNTPVDSKLRDIGPVSADASSFVWASCDTVAAAAVADLLDLAKARGASTVYNITFESKNGRVQTPTCTTSWGWFALYIVPGFGPWMVNSSVDGVAARKDEKSQPKTTEIDIPINSDSRALAYEYIASLHR